MKKFRTGNSLSAAFSIIVVLLAAMAATGQGKTFNVHQARSAFKTAAADHFEMLGDELAGLESEKRPGAYWLVKVKPKKPGHYALKFSYKYNDPFYDEGENVLYVRVGGKVCDRQPHDEGGIARFCLGDTVILPVRAGNRYDYIFDVKYTYEDPANSNVKKTLLPMDPSAELTSNPLATHLRYLGSRRVVQANRSTAPSTVIYYAIFQAVAPGRFNIAVSGSSTGVAPLASGSGKPVIILAPGTPITYLAWKEDTIGYSDNKRFSSHSGGTFNTHLLLLQPGDVIELPYFTTKDDDPLERPAAVKGASPGEMPEPRIQKALFFLHPDWSYNAFIARHFPAASTGEPTR